MTKSQRKKYLKILDLDEEDFMVKIADLGFSKKLKDKE